MNEIEKIIKENDNRVSGKITSFTYKVTEKFDLKEGVILCLFEGTDDHGYIICSSAIGYPSGVVMLLDDWQNGRPTDETEIEDYIWVTSDGRGTIMFDSLSGIL